ncbi:MAG: ADP-ribosylglycohydrolase family protein [Nanoarchaeota archaeon]
MRTVGAVMYLLNNFGDNPAELLKQAILLGGDTDSTASISLGIAMINHSLDKLPEFLLKDLVNHKFGRDFIIDLGIRLSKKYNIA